MVKDFEIIGDIKSCAQYFVIFTNLQIFENKA